MKKFLCSALSFLTSLSLFTGAMSFSAIAFSDVQDIDMGITDMSDEQFVFGESDGFLFDFSDFPAVLSNSDSKTDGWLLGDYLDANNTAVYAQLAKLVTPSMDNITIKLPEPIKFTTSSRLTSSDQNLYNAVFGACSSAVNAVLFDMPEIFWVNQNKITVSPNSLPYSYNKRTMLYTYTLESITISPAYYSGFSDFNEIAEYKEILEKAVEDFVVDGDTTVEKLKDIHDKISYFTYYDMNAKFPSSALGSLVTSGSICESYAKGFKMICDRENIPCLCVFGNYDDETKTAHMWNYVLMEDNCWYAVDVTWDDRDGDDGVEIVDTYFMKGSADFNKNHNPCESYALVNLKYPELAEWNYGENPSFTTTASMNTTTTYTTTFTTSLTETTTESTEEFEYGDLNHDGKVSVADLVYCTSHVLAIQKAEYSCDLNNDNRVDVFDVIIMRQIVSDIVSAGFAK